MRLNKSTSHAIRILIECARSDGHLVKVADLSARLDITIQNVFKIVHLLNRAGLLAAARGRNGGIQLARAADVIRIGDIVRAMETTAMELEGPSGMARSPSAEADVNKVLDTALGAFISVLDQHTIADLARVPAAKRVMPKPAARTVRTREQRAALSEPVQTKKAPLTARKAPL